MCALCAREGPLMKQGRRRGAPAWATCHLRYAGMRCRNTLWLYRALPPKRPCSLTPGPDPPAHHHTSQPSAPSCPCALPPRLAAAHGARARTCAPRHALAGLARQRGRGRGPQGMAAAASGGGETGRGRRPAAAPACAHALSTYRTVAQPTCLPDAPWRHRPCVCCVLRHVGVLGQRQSVTPLPHAPRTCCARLLSAPHILMYRIQQQQQQRAPAAAAAASCSSSPPACPRPTPPSRKEGRTASLPDDSLRSRVQPPTANLRLQSLHDPLLVLNVESEVAGGTSASAARVARFLRAPPCADLPLDMGVLVALL